MGGQQQLGMAGFIAPGPFRSAGWGQGPALPGAAAVRPPPCHPAPAAVAAPLTRGRSSRPLFRPLSASVAGNGGEVKEEGAAAAQLEAPAPEAAPARGGGGWRKKKKETSQEEYEGYVAALKHVPADQAFDKCIHILKETGYDYQVTLRATIEASGRGSGKTLVAALKLWHIMRQRGADVSADTCEYAIRAMARTHQYKMALDLFDEMKQNAMKPTSDTFKHIIMNVFLAREWEDDESEEAVEWSKQAAGVWREMRVEGYVPATSLTNEILRKCLRQGQGRTAAMAVRTEILDEMVVQGEAFRNAVFNSRTYVLAMLTYERLGLFAEVLELFAEVRGELPADLAPEGRNKRQPPRGQVIGELYEEGMKGLGRSRQPKKVVECFEEMRERGGTPSQACFRMYVAACVRTRHIETERVLAVLAESSAPPQVYLDLVERCFDKWDLESVRQVLAEAPTGSKKRGVWGPVWAKTYARVIGVYCKAGDFAKVVEVWREMGKEGSSVEAELDRDIFDAYAKEGQVDSALKVMAEKQEAGLEIHATTFMCVIAAAREAGLSGDALVQALMDVGGGGAGGGSTLLRFLSKSGHYEEARAVVEQMWARGMEVDTAAYMYVIATCVPKARSAAAMELLAEMQEKKVQVDAGVFAAVMNVCVKDKDHKSALKLLGQMRKEGLKPNLGVYCVALVALGEEGPVDKFVETLEEMRSEGGMVPNSIQVRILRVCEKHELYDVAWKEVEHLRKQEESQNRFSQGVAKSKALKACAQLAGGVDTARLLTVSRRIALDACAKLGKGQDAVALLAERRRLGLPIAVHEYNLVIEAYIKERECEAAHGIFLEMQQEGSEPNFATYDALRAAWTEAGEHGKAQQLLAEMRAKGLKKPTGEKKMKGMTVEEKKALGRAEAKKRIKKRVQKEKMLKRAAKKKQEEEKEKAPKAPRHVLRIEELSLEAGVGGQVDAADRLYAEAVSTGELPSPWIEDRTGREVDLRGLSKEASRLVIRHALSSDEAQSELVAVVSRHQPVVEEGEEERKEEMEVVEERRPEEDQQKRRELLEYLVDGLGLFAVVDEHNDVLIRL